MSFTNPVFLWAMFATSIPIIIHLINFRRYKTLYFSNTLFLENIKKETQTRTKLKHILILIARIFTIAMLVFAFSGPFIPNRNLATDEKPTKINAIYIDNSFSMEAEAIKGQVFEQAKQIAKQIIFNSPDGIEYLFISNDMLPEHQMMLDRDAALQNIDKAMICSNSISINDVVLKVNTIIPKGEKVNLYVISDMQKSFFDKDIEIDINNIDAVFIPIKTAKLNNLYIDTCYFDTPIHKYNQKELLKVKIVNSSGEDFFDIPLQLYINDTLKVMASFNIEAEQSKEVNVEYINTISGNIRGRLEISDYPVTYDNTMYFNYNISEYTNVLVINSDKENRYLSALFNSDSDNFKISQVKLGSEQSVTFEKYDIIILNNFSEISTGLSSDLQNFVSNGGSLVFIPSVEINYNICNNFLNLFNAGSFEDGKYKGIRIFNIDYNHELFKNVFQKQEKQTDLPILGLVHKYKIYSSSSYSSILSIENNTPVLIAGNFRNGKLYILSSPISEINSEFLKSSLFVTAFYNMALNSQINNQEYVILEEGSYANISTFTEINEYDILHITNGVDVDVFSNYRIIGKRLNVEIPKDIKKAGDYKLIKGDDVYISHIAINYNRKESDLSYYNMEDLSKYISTSFNDDAKIIDGDSEKISIELREISIGRQLWQLFIFFALIFILCEVFLAKFIK